MRPSEPDLRVVGGRKAASLEADRALRAEDKRDGHPGTSKRVQGQFPAEARVPAAGQPWGRETHYSAPSCGPTFPGASQAVTQICTAVDSDA